MEEPTLEMKRLATAAVVTNLLTDIASIFVENIGTLIEAEPDGCKWVARIVVTPMSEEEFNALQARLFEQRFGWPTPVDPQEIN